MLPIWLKQLSTLDDPRQAKKIKHKLAGSHYKSMQVDFYQRVTGIGITNKDLQVNAS